MEKVTYAKAEAYPTPKIALNILKYSESHHTYPVFTRQYEPLKRGHTFHIFTDPREVNWPRPSSRKKIEGVRRKSGRSGMVWGKHLQHIRKINAQFSRTSMLRALPPPFSYAVNGNRQTFPNPTHMAMQETMNWVEFSHSCLWLVTCTVNNFVHARYFINK